jgi:hypothetical protein
MIYSFLSLCPHNLATKLIQHSIALNSSLYYLFEHIMSICLSDVQMIVLTSHSPCPTSFALVARTHASVNVVNNRQELTHVHKFVRRRHVIVTNGAVLRINVLRWMSEKIAHNMKNTYKGKHLTFCKSVVFIKKNCPVLTSLKLLKNRYALRTCG